MAKLAGDATIYYGGEIYSPGDELPAELSHLSDEPDVDPSPVGGDNPDLGVAPTNPDFDVEKATVPELQAELTRLEVEYSGDDRKDALKAKYNERVNVQS